MAEGMKMKINFTNFAKPLLRKNHDQSERRTVLDDLAHLLSQQESVQGKELRKMLSESGPGMPPSPPEKIQNMAEMNTT